ncbi:MAG: RNA polymerase sigma factor, partial [Armatimonadetes bacterium]|nr:RNA polymerase sigma factor [Armatimonadota bacterium]
MGAADRATIQFDENLHLARRFLEGDQAAFATVYDRYYERIYTLSKGILLDADDAQDAVQETFTLIYKNLRRFHERSRLSTWIFRIAVNTAIQQSRKLKNKKRNVPLDDAEHAQTPAQPATTEVQVKVAEAMRSLSAPDRAVLTLFYWEDVSIIEVARAIDCSPNAAKTRLFRARERFKA